LGVGGQRSVGGEVRQVGLGSKETVEREATHLFLTNIRHRIHDHEIAEVNIIQYQHNII